MVQKLFTARDHFNQNIQLNRWFMTAIGAWPLCEHRKHKFLVNTTATINICFMIFLIIPTTLALMLTENATVYDRAYIAARWFFLFVTATNGFILIVSREKINRCISHIMTDVKPYEEQNLVPEEEIILIETAKTGRSMIKTFALCLYLGVISYNMMRPFVDKTTEMVGNVTVRATTYPIYRGLFDPRDTPWFEIVQIVHAVGGFLMCTNQMTTNCFAVVCVVHACGQLRIIMFRLGGLVNECCDESKKFMCDDVIATHNIGILIEQHLRVFGFISEIEALFSKIYFVGFTGYTLNICFVIYFAIVAWRNHEILLALSFCTLIFLFVINVFLPCFMGELLLDECQKISEATYAIEWFRLSSKNTKLLILIIGISTFSPKLTAWKFMDLSLMTFGKVMKTSLGYLNMLLTL